MSRSGEDTCLVVLSFPRVSGDEPLTDAKVPQAGRFSPRERG